MHWTLVDETAVTAHGWPQTRTVVSVAEKPPPAMVSVAPPAAWCWRARGSIQRALALDAAAGLAQRGAPRG